MDQKVGLAEFLKDKKQKPFLGFRCRVTVVLYLASFAYGKAGFDSWGCCLSWENNTA